MASNKPKNLAVLVAEEHDLAAEAHVADEGFATIPEAQKYLSVSRSKMYSLLDQHVIRSCKIGGNRRIPWSALRGYARQCVDQNS